MSTHATESAEKETILQRIARQRRTDVADARQTVSRDQLSEAVANTEAKLGKPQSLYQRLSKPKSGRIRVAAEFKKASPSKGDIATDLVPGEQALKYANAGADVVSVLTEPKWFKGSLEDMLQARESVGGLGDARPLILRKDFVVDEYQLHEARAFGADTVLLIVAILSFDELVSLIAAARALHMEPLVEVANEEEMLVALKANAKVIGVNNRNLHTFKVDMTTTTRMVSVAREQGAIGPGVEEPVLVVALSGVKCRADVVVYEQFGDVCAILVGETLMRAENPQEMIDELVSDPVDKDLVHVKICGIREPEDALVAAQAGADMIGVIFAKSKRIASIEQAQAVVSAIRKFRERDGVVEIEKPTTVNKDSSVSDWYSGWSKTLSERFVGRERPLVVGVFMNQDVEEVNRIAIETGVDLIQLHGSEGYEVADVLCRPVVRVVHVEQGSDNSVLDKLQGGHAAAVLLDTSVKGEATGGTGKTFDWSIARQVRDGGVPVIMAGGLTPSNVREAVDTGKAWCVDVASGVEESPGVKDHAKIKSFIANAKGVACKI